MQQPHSYAKRIQYTSILPDQALITTFPACRRAKVRKTEKVKRKYLILAEFFHKINY